MQRFFDVIFSTLLLVMLTPILLTSALLIRWHLGSPLFFRQERTGWLGRRFAVTKFRTMRDAMDKHGQLLPDDKRVTRFGKIIRSLSIDELPQLWNIFKGDMTFIGPRPLLTEYDERYNSEQQKRFFAKPGVTGWAQVNGRNAISWEEKFAYDVWYVEHRSLKLDLKILLLTAQKVLFQKDINQAGCATMPRFKGSPENSKRHS